MRHRTHNPAGSRRNAVPSRPGCVSPRASAFTLLELLLAVTLVGLIAAMAAGMLRAGVNTRRVVNATVDESRTLRLALDQMARPLSSALPPSGLLAGPFIGAADGESDGLTFHASVAPSGDAFGGDIIYLAYRLDRTSYSTPALICESTRNLLATVAAELDTTVLCRNVESVEFQYYDGAGMAWVDEWDSTETGNTLPAAVLITLTLVDEDEKDNRDAPTLRRLVTLPCVVGQGGGG